jgi:hypothetical protein
VDKFGAGFFSADKAQKILRESDNAGQVLRSGSFAQFIIFQFLTRAAD